MNSPPLVGQTIRGRGPNYQNKLILTVGISGQASAQSVNLLQQRLIVELIVLVAGRDGECDGELRVSAADSVDTAAEDESSPASANSRILVASSGSVIHGSSAVGLNVRFHMRDNKPQATAQADASGAALATDATERAVRHLRPVPQLAIPPGAPGDAVGADGALGADAAVGAVR